MVCLRIDEFLDSMKYWHNFSVISSAFYVVFPVPSNPHSYRTWNLIESGPEYHLSDKPTHQHRPGCHLP